MDDPSPTGPAPRRFRAGFAAVAFVLAFLLTTAWLHQSAATKQSAGRRRELADLVGKRQLRTAGLARELAQLRTRADRLRATRGGRALTDAQREIDRLSLLAGTTAVHGTGLSVTLSDSPLARSNDSPDYVIQDVDLQLVVNELWAAGAEAIAVNGQRLVATSAIRTAGVAVLVNYKVLASPYRVEAVGDSATLLDRFEQSEVAQRFHNWTSVYKLGFAVKQSGSIQIPAFQGGLRFRYAHP